MIGSDQEVAPSSAEKRSLSLHVEINMQGLGDHVNSVNSRLKLEQILLKLAKGSQVHGGIYITISGKHSLPTKVNNLSEAVSGYLERVFKLEQMVDTLATQSKDIKELMLVGLTGSGKTELARAYAKHYEAALTQAQLSSAILSSGSSWVSVE